MRGTYADPHAMEQRRKHIKILFYEDAADATVSVERGDGIAAKDDIGLRINGKVDASSQADLSTQYLLAHLPMAGRPESKEVFVLGLGSGITAGALLAHPVERVTIAENCEPVLRASQFFAKWNRNPLADPRVQVRNEDARTVLKLSPQKYDVIISEPSNPWMIGVGSVFSREFYTLASSRLKEGGLMCQWFHMYEMNDDIVGLVLRSFGSVFPYLELWDPGFGDIILLGGLRPWKSSPEVYQRAFDQEEVRKDLAAIGLSTPQSLWARQLASQRTAFAIAGDGPKQSDAYPILEYQAPKAFFVGAEAENFSLFDERTWQWDLASMEKVDTLRALDVKVVHAAFERFNSVNWQLTSYLASRFSVAENQTNSNPNMPCIFRTPGSRPIQAKVPDNASEVWKRLLEASNAVQADPASWLEPVTTIQTVLTSSKLDPGLKVAGQSPLDLAALAAKACLRHGDKERARTLVQAGLKMEPRSVELLFIARILEREAEEVAPNAQ